MAKQSTATWARIARRIRVPAGFVFSVLYILLAHPSGKSIWLGMVLVSVGLLVRALASAQLNKNEELAVGGLYAYTRNPLYLGSLILGVGFALAAKNPWIIAIAGIIFVFIYVPVIRSEEEFLRAKFPEFERYAREVPRLVPRFRGLRDSGFIFSWSLYLKHREYNAALGSAILIGALLAKLAWALQHR